MNLIPNDITHFLESFKICTICFVDEDNKPHCINCFYYFDAENQLLVFKSSTGTNHTSLTKDGVPVSGTVLPEHIDLLKIKGLQFSGSIISNKEASNYNISFNYHKKYPVAIAMPGYIWAVKLNNLKYTDNSLVFGKKIIWKSKSTIL